MNDQQRRSNPSDPTAERTAEESRETAAGSSGGRGGPEVASEHQADEVLDRSAEERYDTPRKYEQGDEIREDREHTDPVLPADDATLNTKI